ncbi:MAG: hypothetical protein ABR530_03750 [Pyrinomonadaceae bacterium]
MKNSIFIGLVALIFFVGLTSAVHAQRDYFTPEEVELIREAQQIDARVSVLTRAIDRRLAHLKIGASTLKVLSKEAEKWGELPAASREQYLRDIKLILQKAIDDIDSLAERPESAVLPDPKQKNAKGYAELFPKAVRSLAAAAERYLPILQSELDKANTATETGAIMYSIEMCRQIIESVAKLPTEAPKKKGKNR